jgi:hypothetical protein
MLCLSPYQEMRRSFGQRAAFKKGEIMTTEKVEVSLVLPRDLWEQLLERAQTGQEDETALMIRAIDQFLQQEATRIALAERLQRECEELATMEFDDIGTEDEWLIIQNEALNKAEIDLA